MTTQTTDVEKTAEKALKLMRTLGIPLLPQNYAVWYHYAASDSAPLTQELDKAIREAVPLDAELHAYLYTKYIAPAEPPSHQTFQDAKHLLARILGIINNFSGENLSYQKEIGHHLSGLSALEPEPEDVTHMVEQIIERTKSLKERSESMNQRLESSRREVEGLRQHLVEVTQEAQRDFLTGVFNRQAFNKIMDNLIREAEEQHANLCMLMIDIDHFKQFNDTYGHLIGDEVLKTVAHILTDTLKGRDIVTRFGGEEFAIMLPSTSLAGAMTVAEQLRQAIASKELKHRDTGESFGRVTVSIGVAAFRPGKDTLPTLIRRADEALYASKKHGRNRITPEEAATATASG